jgi:biopolymer transport protein ExbD
MCPARSSPTKLFAGIGGTMFVYVSLTLVLLLLITAMVSAEHPHCGTIGLAYVPHAKPMPNALRRDAIIVSVLRNGDVFFVRDRILPEQLVGLIRGRLVTGSERKIYIRADGRAHYRYVKEVLDAVHTTGAENVAFFAEQHPITYFH